LARSPTRRTIHPKARGSSSFAPPHRLCGPAAAAIPIHRSKEPKIRSPEESEMKLSRIAATAATAAAVTFVCAAAYAQAQTQADTSQPVDPNALAAVGGSPGAQTAMGAPAGKTRDQVYRDLVNSQHNGDQQRLKDLFKGGS
jgi:hypothetical protein